MLTHNMDLAIWATERFGGPYESDVFVYVDAKSHEFVCALCSLINSDYKGKPEAYRTPWLLELRTHLEGHLAVNQLVPIQLIKLLDTISEVITSQGKFRLDDQIRLVEPK